MLKERLIARNKGGFSQISRFLWAKTYNKFCLSTKESILGQNKGFIPYGTLGDFEEARGANSEPRDTKSVRNIFPECNCRLSFRF